MKSDVLTESAYPSVHVGSASVEPVLYVLKRFPRLSETFVLHELLGLEAAGERVLVDALLPPEDEPRHPELTALRASVRYLPRHPRWNQRAVAAAHIRTAGRSPLVWLRLAARARRHGQWRRFVQAGMVADRIRTDGVRHVHAHFATAAAEVARDAAALARVPITVTAHAKDVFETANAAQLPRRLRGVSAVVTVSRFNVEHLRNVFPSLPVTHVPNGIRAAPASTPIPAGPVLCVARLVPKKGVDVLVDAAGLLPAGAAQIEVIGGGPLAADLVRRVKTGPAQGRVRFLGPQSSDEVDLAYRRCSMVVLPCRVAEDGDRDGLPTVLLEAMAHGLPVISTDVVGIPEVVRHGETGLIVPPDDPEALAAAIASLVADPVFAQRLGSQGRDLVLRRFDPARSIAALRAVWSSVAPAGAGR
jgi:glycosyltransferase involved in cell wall biosynthesis